MWLAKWCMLVSEEIGIVYRARDSATVLYTIDFSFRHWESISNNIKPTSWIWNCPPSILTKYQLIDLLPNYSPGTSKRYRKPVTTSNTVIFYYEKRNFRRSSDLAAAKIYLFAVLFIFDMPSTNHFFWSFCAQVGITLDLEGFSGVFVFRRSALLYRNFGKVSTAWTSQNRAGHSNQP